MPWEIEKRGGEWCVIKAEDGESEGCHGARKEALAQLAALNIAEEDNMSEKQTMRTEKEISLDEQTRRVRDAWYVRFEPTHPVGVEVSASQRGWIKEVFSDRVIVEFSEVLFSYGYTVSDEGISFEEPVKVEVSYTTVEKGLLRRIAETVSKIAQVVFKKAAPSVLDLSGLQKTGFIVTKDKKTGKRRWLGVPSSAFYPDREQEALSTKALTNAIDRMMESGKPTTKEGKEVILDLAHVHGVDLGTADLVGMCGPFLVASGLENDGPYSKGFFDWVEQNPDEDMRMSIEFEYDAAQKDESGVYLDGVDIIRFTALPAAMAANPVTAFLVVDAKSEGGSAMKLDERVRPLLSEIYGEEVVTGIEGQLVEAKDAAEAAGLREKSTDAETETPESETDTETDIETEDVAPEALTEAALREIIGEVVAEVLGDVPGEVKALTGRLELIETARETEIKAANARTRKYVFAPAEPVRKGGEPGSLSEAGVPMTSPLRQAGG